MALPSPVLRLRSLAVSLLALAAIAACSSAQPTSLERIPDGGKRVLFIGNSLTYWNDLPRAIADLATEMGDTTLTYRTVVYPDYSLEDHWARGDAQRAIAATKWDVVVLQQGPSALPESRVLLVEYAKRFAPLIVKAGAKPALYGVWPSASRRFDFAESRNSYAAAASAVNGALYSVGAAWTAAWARDPALPLYSADGLHPSPLGTYLAAIVMYQGLYGRSPLDLPAVARVGGIALNVPPATIRLLQSAAAETIAREDAQ